MKTIKLLFAIAFLAMVFTSCTDENDDPITITENPLEEFNLLTSIDANNHIIEVYSEQNQYTIGYNELFYRIKDQGTASYVSNAEIKLTPVMHMVSMMHSCPKSAIVKTEDASVYKGYSIFQMPGNADEYWEFNFEYTINGQTYEASERVAVDAPTDGKKRVSSFMGADDKRYIIAMMPIEPEVKVNDFSAMVFTMKNMMQFPLVENYTILIDPRMPGMGNHSSPNNEHLNFDAATGMYTGKLSLTMTGYWKINLKLMSAADEVLKGEDVTDENEGSSLYFELEF
ncbi:hypothetical protein ACFQZJ_02895 [Maribacter chungangensis]|uniref:YtkA-like domain-containing protein n=1 Tax=Maribacter chungangensis TaxID=1069117 RepID=A0ABW3B0V9_9FLAO